MYINSSRKQLVYITRTSPGCPIPYSPGVCSSLHLEYCGAGPRKSCHGACRDQSWLPRTMPLPWRLIFYQQYCPLRGDARRNVPALHQTDRRSLHLIRSFLYGSDVHDFQVDVDFRFPLVLSFLIWQCGYHLSPAETSIIAIFLGRAFVAETVDQLNLVKR